METKELNSMSDYNAGYIACESDQPFDESMSDEWKKGYRDKEVERLFRSIQYHAKHIVYPDSSLFSCYNLMKNPHSSTGTEYHCYYQSGPARNRITCKNGCSCIEAMLADVLRLLNPDGTTYTESQIECLAEMQEYLNKVVDALGKTNGQ